ncbi:hypothetical protein OC834_007709 [Tilletia horrida]|nr:hypothetical protein OC834_007709 [Tilletia horrida]
MAERIAGDGALINVYDYRQATGRQGQQELPRDAQVLLHAVKAASSNRPSPVFGIMSVISSTSAYQGEKMLPKSSFNKLHNDVKSDPDKRLVRMRLWSHIHKVPSPLKEITNDARVMQILKLMQRVYTAQLQGPSNSKEQCQIWLGMGAVSGSITLTAEVQGQLRGWTSQTETEGQVQPQQVLLRYDHIRRELLGRGPSGDAHKIPLEWNSTSELGRRVLYAIGTSFLGTPGPALLPFPVPSMRLLEMEG